MASNHKTARPPWSEKHVKAAKVECIRWAADEIELGHEAIALRMIRLAEGHAHRGEWLFFRAATVVLARQRDVDRLRQRIFARADGRMIKDPVDVRLVARFDDWPDEDGDEAFVRARVKESVRSGARVVKVTTTKRRILRKAPTS